MGKRRREEEAEQRRRDEADAAAALRRREQEEELDAKTRLDAWMKQRNFDGVNEIRKSRMKAKFPLHSAVKVKDVETIKLLLRFNADPSNMDSNGLTAQQVAERNNKDGSLNNIIQALTSGGAGVGRERQFSLLRVRFGFEFTSLFCQCPTEFSIDLL